MSSFSLLFAADTDGEVSLTATLDSGEFKGRGFYWCPASEFTALATALQTYPILSGNFVGGRWYDGCIDLAIEPVNSVGRLLVSVELQEFGSDWTMCRARFQANYADLDRFREQLENVLAEGIGEAVLSSK